MPTHNEGRPFHNWLTRMLRRRGEARRTSWIEWIAAALASILVVAALPGGMAAAQNTPTLQNSSTVSAEARRHDEWRTSMKRLPLPKHGCFTAAYPSRKWEEVPCRKPPAVPFLPAHGIRPTVVGNGNDNSAQTAGTISSASGSFDSVTGLTSEKDAGANDNYSLQLNTNFFATAFCNGAADPSNCQGWQQFIFSNMPDSININSSCTHFGGACVFIQYWLIGYGNSCPSGWTSAQSNCFRNGENGVSVDRQAIAKLGQLSLTGTASAISDTVVFFSADGRAHAVSELSVLNLDRGWQAAEFNVVGNCCSTQADFNLGSTLVVRTSINDGTMNAPSCVSTGTTGETNNLTLSGRCTSAGGTSPAIVFTERFLAPVAAVSTPFVDDYHDQQHFTYATSTGDVWDAYSCPSCDDGSWHLQKINDVGGVTQGPSAMSTPSVDVYSSADQQHFAYLAANGEIWDAYYCPQCGGTQWQLQKINLNGVTSGVAAVTTPAVDEFVGHDQQHFAYQAANGDIWDAYYCPKCSGTAWKLQKINNGGMTSGPPAVAQPVISTYAAHDQQHFVYLAANGEIWDAFYCPQCSGNPWKLQEINLNGVTKGPAALAPPSVNVYVEADQQHFAYLAANGEIWDAYYCPKCGSGEWKLQRINLGGVTTGPAASSAPFASEYVLIPTSLVRNQQHFAYTTPAGDIWDAYYCPECAGNPWKLQEITAGGVTPGPSAVPSLAPFVSVDADQQHFAYVTGSGALWDAYYCAECGDGEWKLQQLAGP